MISPTTPTLSRPCSRAEVGREVLAAVDQLAIADPRIGHRATAHEATGRPGIGLPKIAGRNLGDLSGAAPVTVLVEALAEREAAADSVVVVDLVRRAAAMGPTRLMRASLDWNTSSTRSCMSCIRFADIIRRWLDSMQIGFT
jgi:hypothetical protein